MEFPLTLGLQKTGLPLIATSGKPKNLCFLVDTGATHNVLFTYVFEHFKNEFKVLGDYQSTMGIEGNYKEYPTIEATFTFEGIVTLKLYCFGCYKCSDTATRRNRGANSWHSKY